MKPLKLLEYVHAREDPLFDLAYPPPIRELSSLHWTPVNVARRAAEFLVREPGTRVLDIGCGPGKFCIVGALSTPGSFTGVEQRKYLCDLARMIIEQAGIPNAEVWHGNVTAIDFGCFDAFYLFNPFEEHLEPAMRIDESIPLGEAHYEHYAEHVARQLAQAPLGTRVATYCGSCEEVPPGYDCLEVAQEFNQKLWEKTRHHPLRTPAKAAPTARAWHPLAGPKPAMRLT